MLEAWSDATTWITTVDVDYQRFDEALRGIIFGGRAFSATHYDSVVTFFHETTHFWHAISTNFLFEYSSERLFSNIRLLKHIRQEQSMPADLTALSKDAQALFATSDGSPVRTIDVIEGCAVFVSYRLCSYEAAHGDYIEYLAKEHPGQPKYTRAYHHASAMLGVDAFALFSVICYLALQTRNPGQEFCKLSARLRTLQGSDHQQFSQILDDPSVAMVATSAKGTDDRFVPFVIANPGRWPHPILDPYIQLIKQLSVLSDGASAWLEDFFARPHRYLREHDLPGQCLEVLFGTARGQNTSTFVFINDYTRFVLAAPIRIHVNPAEARTMRGTVTFGNPVTVVPMGIAVSDREYAQFTLDMTAAFGMLQTLSAPESADCAFYCPQQDCPVYRSRICRMYYKFPIQAGQYRDCAFPQLLYELHLNLDTILGIIENQRVPTQRRGYDNTYPYLTKAIELKPGDAEAYYLRGVVKRAKGDLDGANADYSKVIELKPDYAEAYYNRGDVKQAKGDLDGAVADYSKAIELKPDYAEAYVNRGVAKGAKGDLDGAIADLTKAIELKADYAEAYINRGVAKYTKDDLDGAIADFSKAIELKPDYAEAYYYRGHAKQAKGDMDGAIADLTKASELKPGVFQ